ncbi:hypothetical protein CY34DRAFT_802871 [Suillus luteus UH-Slu-Lm8-n1]|uniref:Uncharacterized protein n=1 Tax=Suillus luteus UH-Slu-Lm8-n1 TaxID=930992 RepID=A0A0D0B2L0_9AGAM|nr:hypothetical protein CY34DRAFT_802871 [Suillus luteus UH-Slu-Lm8-n1]
MTGIACTFNAGRGILWVGKDWTTGMARDLLASASQILRGDLEVVDLTHLRLKNFWH